jgi:hypothetical protein
MKSKAYAIALSQDPAAVVQRARSEASSSGVAFDGDESEGQFAGKGIHGSYKIVGEQLTITITKKPLLYPWGMIERSIRSFFV